METKIYKDLIDFLGIFFGPETEIILSDRDKILYVVNALSSQTIVGSPIGGMLKSFLDNDNFTGVPYTVNYRALSNSGHKLRSATLFIRDEKEEIEGMLTINCTVEELIVFRQILDRLIQGYTYTPSFIEKSNKKDGKDYFETLTISVSDTIDDIISKASIHFGSQPTRFTSKEKMSVVKELDNKGVFLVKGSVREVAQKLKASEATIYRYLDNLQH